VVSLIPACFMTSRLYYSLRRHFAQKRIYRKARRNGCRFCSPRTLIATGRRGLRNGAGECLANPLNILMASGVLKRREAAWRQSSITGHELERLGHHLTYVFKKIWVSPEHFATVDRIIFSLRWAATSRNRKMFSD